MRLLLGLRPQRRLLLVAVVEEDGRAVLVSDVPSLAVQLRRVVLAPEHLQQVVVRELLVVVRDLDDLRVAGGVRAHVLVRRVLGVTAGVADAGPRDSFELPERRLDAPEAACSERCLSLHYSSS